MRLKSSYLLLLFLGAGYFFVPTMSAQGGSISAGISAEFNNHNKDGGAIGGGFMVGYALNTQFAAGLRVSFFHAAENLSSLEPKAFFRYNLPWVQGLFAQAEVGAVLYFYYGEVFPVFSGGAALGWRHQFTNNFFIEPSVRFGYPHIWGAGVTAGYTFSRRNHD